MAETEPKRVLIADDEINIRRVLEAILRRDGYDVVTAANGLEALAGMTRGVHTVITDLKMPGLDGMGLLRKLSSEYPDVPVVMITAHGSVENAVEAVKLGAFDYIEKPFDQEQIRQVVDKALRTHSFARRDARMEEPVARGRFAWWASRRHPPGLRRHREGGRHALDGADHRRVGHRQGADRPGPARVLLAPRRGPSSRSTAPPSPRP
jgi:DNA-binding NtrC family response regulator